MNRSKHAVVALLGICFISLGAASRSEAENFNPEYQEITWEQLIPESWRSEDFFADRNLDGLSDDDPAADKAMAVYLERMKNAPADRAWAGRYIRIFGFVVPLEWDNESAISEFLLVPYFGACIHVPPPPPNQIIHVRLDKPAKGLQSMETVLVYGQINIDNDLPDIYNSIYNIKSGKLEIIRERSHLVLAMGLTLFSGLSMCFAWIFIYACKKLDSRLLCAGTGFSAGIMSSIGVSTLFRQISWIGIYSFLAGVAFMSMISFLSHRTNRGRIPFQNPRHTGKYASLVIAAHNLPECFALFSVTLYNPALGFALAGAITAHNVPLGFSVALPIRDSGQTCHAWRYAILIGLVPPLAAIVIHLLMRPFFSPENLDILVPCVGGVMALLSITELIPSARRYGGPCAVLCAYCSGILFALLTLILFPVGR
ncbi:MAG: DUF3299 domain-containing protein [Candidatus Accumulibacter sp.]|jgi:zinc transporter ZupT|nr:DUF3299 domain-containing protein [Accumulibacter sp.]